jgi:hypothetical protein
VEGPVGGVEPSCQVDDRLGRLGRAHAGRRRRAA